MWKTAILPLPTSWWLMEVIQKLAAALTSQADRDFIQSKYQGQILPAFGN
jgi:hypothetical protein